MSTVPFCYTLKKLNCQPSHTINYQIHIKWNKLPAPLLNVRCSSRCILGPKFPNRWEGKPLASRRAKTEKRGNKWIWKQMMTSQFAIAYSKQLHIAYYYSTTIRCCRFVNTNQIKHCHHVNPVNLVLANLGPSENSEYYF